jgi:FkbM family methyltransferase
MELVSNQTADFTRWVSGTGLLHEPFVIVDVGVQGGENLRWHALGDHLILHGFDPIETVVEQLQTANRRPNVTYYCMALGNADGTIELFINEADPYSSSMYRHGESRFHRRDPRLRTRQVPIRRLDGLIEEGSVPRPDFLKVDVEGFEGEVLLGCARHLDGLCGFEVESNFGISAVYPNTHFGSMMETALAHRLLVFDLEFNRVPTIKYQEALAHKGLDQVRDHISVGKPAMLNVLFARDLIQEADNPELYQLPALSLGIDFLIKQLVVFELYGLNDIAVDLARRLAALIGQRLDVDEAVYLLTDPHSRVPGGSAAVQAKLEYEAAERLAVERRILELESTLAAHRDAHAATVSAVTKQWAAEREASDRRIRELESEFAAYRAAHAAAVDRIIREAPAPAARRVPLLSRFRWH